MTTLTVTPEQATILARMLQERDAATQRAQLVLDAMTAGRVPPRAELRHIDTVKGELVFHVESDEAPHAD